MRLNFQENRPKTIVKYVEKKDYTIVYTIGFIILCVIVLIIGFNVFRSNKCNGIENKILDYAYDYANNNNLLNLNEGDSVTILLDDIYNNGYPLITNGSTCYGSVKFTMADGNIIKTFDITGCSYCSTDKRYGSSWKKSNSFVNSRLVDVDVKYNYYNAETFYTNWTDYYPSSDINNSLDAQYNVMLPIDSNKLPKVPSTSEVLRYDVEYTTFYSYRDELWLWYKNPNSNYSSDFYSEKPINYNYKDEATLKYTDLSDWSLNYPDNKDYREIKSSTGYRWYYVDDNKNKHYWNGGAYAVSKPNDEYSLSEGSATLYSYRDKTWKWYNGEKRGYYSEYSSTAQRDYIYKDISFSKYSNWSKWTSNIPEKKSYRTIKTDIYYRYRAFYRDINYLVLDSFVSREEFESIVNMSLDTFRLDGTKKLSYSYTYLYK